MESAIARRRTSEAPSLSRAISPTPSASTVLTDAPSPSRPTPLNHLDDTEAVQFYRELQLMREHDDGAWLAWARRPGTVSLASRWLTACGVDGRLAERMLSLLYLSRADSLSCDGAGVESEADARMTQEARHFEAAVRTHLAVNVDGDATPPAASLSTALGRALRVLCEWTKQAAWSKWPGSQPPMRPPTASEAHPLARGCPLRPKGEHLPLGSQRDIAVALWCPPKVADFTAFLF